MTFLDDDRVGGGGRDPTSVLITSLETSGVSISHLNPIPDSLPFLVPMTPTLSLTLCSLPLVFPVWRVFGLTLMETGIYFPFPFFTQRDKYLRSSKTITLLKR